MKSSSLVAPAILFLVALTLLASAPQKSLKAVSSSEAARLNNLGCAYMNQQLFERALKAFQAASALDAKLLEARINQGIALANLQRIDEAKKLLLDAVKNDPKNPHAWYNLGLIYKNSGEPEAAADGFRRVREIDPNDADTWYLLGTVYLQQKQFPQAIDSFQHALKLNPLHASAEFGLSRAYQQSGDTTVARQHLTRFQYITQNKLGATMSLAYGEQGKYSRAEESPAFVEHGSPAIEVRFVNTTQQAGLLNRAAPLAHDVPALLGPGACFLDYDGDGKLDILLADGGKQGGLSLYHNLGNGKFEEITKKAKLDPELHATGCTAGDYDNDGAVDLAVSVNGRIILFHNEKNDTFTDATEATGLAGTVPSIAATGTDYNNDRAVDIVSTTQERMPTVFENPREGKFLPRQLWPESVIPLPVGVAVLDFDHDGWMDIAVTHANPEALTLWRNREGKGFERVRLPETKWSAAWGVAAIDYDNDGWVDLAAVGVTKDGKGEIQIGRASCRGRW